MIKGKKVVINDKYYVSEKNKGKIFEVTSEPYSVCGTVVVKLKGLSGCYALDGLDEVNYGKPYYDQCVFDLVICSICNISDSFNFDFHLRFANWRVQYCF